VFPQVDPIPLPAPVWLFKMLEMLTVSLHFLAVQLLVGGLACASIWAWLGRRRAQPELLDASGAIAVRLPVVMTFVINLGVPPLLFAQVLYGRALYTSSVLIGAFWFAVIFLLMASYTCLYYIAHRAGRSQGWAWIGLIALLIIVKVGFIYSSNMTLMLRPEAWREMYRSDGFGRHLNSGDPTVWPRWLYMMFGGLTVGGVGLMALGLVKQLRAETGEFLRRWGGRLAVAGVAVQGVLGLWVSLAQPAAVRSGLWHNWVYVLCFFAWIASAVLLGLAAWAGQASAAEAGWKWPAAAGLMVFLLNLVAVVYRGGIRDVTLSGFSFNVWAREVAANWVVVAAFLLLFVFGLAAVAWLTSIVFRMEKVEERYA
jgi:hypothetical protein